MFDSESFDSYKNLILNINKEKNPRTWKTFSFYRFSLNCYVFNWLYLLECNKAMIKPMGNFCFFFKLKKNSHMGNITPPIGG